MTLEEERDYWKELVGIMSDNMDRNAFRLYEWQKVSEELAEHLKCYLDWPENKEMMNSYIALNRFYTLKNKL